MLPPGMRKKRGGAFAAADADGDGLLTSGEFVQTPVGLFSTPRAFKSIDRNADGRLDAAELVARGPGWSKTLAERSAEAFDADGDGVLSFREYRSTPAANPIGDSLQRLTDQNGDGRLSFREFAGGWKGGPPGLTAFFFGQFDRDGDGGLTASEFPFRERTPRDPPEKEEEVVKDYGEEFASRDENGDGSLDREEFLSDARGKKFFPDAQRNFTVYDLDGDGSLQLEEYLQTPATRGDEGPGRVADPISRLVDRAVSRFEGWLAEHDGNGDGGLDLTEFRAVEPADDGGRWGAAFADWSRNRTKLVTTEDARLAAEIAYGVRGPDGSPRRSEQGRVADEGAFRLRDEDGDGSLTAAEYSTYSKNKESAARRFAEADADGSGRLTFEEFRRAPGGSYDTVREYKRADEDEDGLLDASELADDVPRPEQELARKSVVAFDGDGDGQLNFSEFRLTPVANPTGPQLHRLREFDDGGGLDRREFRDEWEGGPPALADLYFDRFDADADGVLSVKEAPFRVKLSGVPPGAAFAARDADGDGRMSLRELHAAAAGVTAADDLAELDQRKLMRSEEALRAADEDRDGLLSLDEFEALSETEAERKANPVGKARPPNPAAVQAALAEDESWFGLGRLDPRLHRVRRAADRGRGVVVVAPAEDEVRRGRVGEMNRLRRLLQTLANLPGRLDARPRLVWGVVVTLLTIHAGLLAYAATTHSPTLNEPGHLVAGLSNWKFGRFELYRVNPPLTRTVAALPVIAAGYEEDWGGFYEGPGARPVFGMGGGLHRRQRPAVDLAVHDRPLGLHPVQPDRRDVLLPLVAGAVGQQRQWAALADALVLFAEHSGPCRIGHA